MHVYIETEALHLTIFAAEEQQILHTLACVCSMQCA